MSNLIRVSLLGSALVAMGCDATDFRRNPDGNAAFYNGAGSEWTAQLNPDRTFMLLHYPMLGQMTADQLINGSYAAQANGLEALTVTSSAGTGQADEGAAGTAAEIPGALLVVNPFAGGNLLAMVPAGSCPSSAASANLIKLKTAAGWTTSTADSSATFAYDPNSNAALLPSRYALVDPAMPIDRSPVSLGAGSCGGGIVTTDGGAELFLTDGGALLVHTNVASEEQGLDEIYLGLPEADQALDPTSLAGSYAGFLFVDEATPVHTPVELTLTANGASVGGTTAAGDGSQGGAQIQLNAAGASNGLVTGAIETTAGAAQPLVCAAQIGVASSSQNLLVCAGASESGRLASLILIGSS